MEELKLLKNEFLVRQKLSLVEKNMAQIIQKQDSLKI